MNSVSLIPYAPLPCTTGARVIFLKHLHFLNKQGRCTVASARQLPVGGGWGADIVQDLKGQGFELVFRNKWGGSSFPYVIGMLYACFFKILKQEKAFGHSNLYHRYAFPSDWWYEQTVNKDIAEIHYSYWSRLPCACPKVVVLHDMWSDLMWEGVRRESAELALADLIVTVSIEDRDKLIQRGMKNVHWSPPRVKPLECADASEVCVVASGNHHNVEGLEWLKSSTEKMPTQVHCYGSISDYVGDDDRFLSEGNYAASSEPYEKCGIVLMLTSSGTGVQIKGVEALAHGRVIIARKGAMRGLPSGEIGWVEVDSPDEMVDVLKKAYRDRQYREKMSLASKEYYKKYLESEVVDRRLLEKYRELL